MQREVDLHAIELGQPTLGKAPERLDAVDVGTALGKGFLFVDADVLVVAHVHQTIVAGPAIRADDARRINPAPDHRSQSGLGAIRDDFGVNFSLAFKDAEDRLFECSPAPQAWQRTASHAAGAEVAFIDFDHAAKLPTLIHSLPSDEQSETLVEEVDGVAVKFQKCRRLGGSQVQGKAFHHFSNLVLA